jgi:hypothetical protein
MTAQARVPERKAKTAGIEARCHLLARSGVRGVCLLLKALAGSIEVMVAITLVWIITGTSKTMVVVGELDSEIKSYLNDDSV